MLTIYLFAIASDFVIENPDRNFLVIMKDGRVVKETLG